ncbi:stalk domain-containing protein [Natranaerobius thermophilus]|uniref:Copper amine oxidase domain protein n=1 Tax=Natranaerobius thermophilus (strain ATCC BAA-1301 / DSM 18059 / JW/NM-WN-LF) TaxID=457570 RepID=B2A0Q6_NATTJ|nr:transglutaminase domain-containing protein [Natranaerobius thermophilus]ACB85936.1 copper amine oxidase domain protein [Natranaerobius thermophilus JW/NM-WN-LF]
MRLSWALIILIIVPLLIFVPGPDQDEALADGLSPEDTIESSQMVAGGQALSEFREAIGVSLMNQSYYKNHNEEEGANTDNDQSSEYQSRPTNKENPGNNSESGWLISQWQSTGGPYSGEVLAITQDPHKPHHMYAGTPHGLFKSFNKGENWYDLGVTNSSINDISVSKVDEDLVYMATDEGLYLSRDGGAQWDYYQGSLEGLETYFVTTVEDPIFNETTLVGTNDGAYVSRTKGSSFTQIGYEGEKVTAGKIHKSAPEQLYLAVDDVGLVQSGNRGNTWDVISDDFVGEVLTISINPSFPYIMYLGTTNGIYASYDRGASWEHEGVLGTPVYEIWMDPELPIHIMAATEGEGIKRSTNAGDHWESVCEELQDIDFLSMILDVEDDEQFYFGTGEQGIVSLDLRSGDHAVLNEGLTTYVHELYSSSLDPSKLVAVSDDNVYYSDDRGEDWINILNERPRAVATWSDPEITLEDYDQEGADNREFESGSEQLYMVAGEKLLISDFGEQYYDRVTLDGLDRQIYNLSVHPMDKEEVWAGTDQGVYVSRDAGETWEHLGLEDQFVEYLDVSFERERNMTVVYAGGYAGVSRYVEGYGDTELSIEADQELSDEQDDKEDTDAEESEEDSENDVDWLQEQGEIEEFQEIITREDYALSEIEVADFNPEKIWLGTLGRGLYHSQNAGESFESRNTGLPGSRDAEDTEYLPAVVSLDVYPNNPEKVLAGLESGVYFSGNSGQEWQLINDLQLRVESFSAHFGPPTALYMGTEEGVYRHEAYEIPHLGWEDEEHYTLDNPDVYRFEEHFELKNTTNETKENVVFMAPKVLNHGIYQFRYDYNLDSEPSQTLTKENYDQLDGNAYDVEESWFEKGNEILVFEKDKLGPEETWDIKVNNEVVVFETYYDLDTMDPEPYDTNSEFYQLYTGPDEMSPSDHEEIQNRAAHVVGDAEEPIEKVENIFNWVKDYLEYVPPGNVGALEAYRSGEGVCADYADLFVALARAEGIPARRLSGYYISGPDEGQYHAWSEFYLEGYGWVPVEPTFDAWYSDFFGELPDTSHIFMSYGVVRHEFTEGLEFKESFDIEKVSLDEMGFRQEDILDILEEDELELDQNGEQEQLENEENHETGGQDENHGDNETIEDQDSDNQENTSNDNQDQNSDRNQEENSNHDQAEEQEENSWERLILTKLGSNSLEINDKITGEQTSKEMDVESYVSQGRTLVPLRFVADSLGANVDYLPDEGIARVIQENQSISMFVSEETKHETALVNGEEVELEVPAEIKNGRTMVPLRFVNEQMGSYVTYDEDTKEISIYY